MLKKQRDSEQHALHAERKASVPTERCGEGLKELRCLFVEKGCDGDRRGTVVLHDCKVHEAGAGTIYRTVSQW